MFFCSLAGYAFARLQFRGRDTLFVLYLGTLMVPLTVTVIPQFIIMRVLGWTDTPWALSLIHIYNYCCAGDKCRTNSVMERSKR